MVGALLVSIRRGIRSRAMDVRRRIAFLLEGNRRLRIRGFLPSVPDRVTFAHETATEAVVAFGMLFVTFLLAPSAGHAAGFGSVTEYSLSPLPVHLPLCRRHIRIVFAIVMILLFGSHELLPPWQRRLVIIIIALKIS